MPLLLKAKSGGGDFKSVPSGSHIAVCNLIADLGLQPGSAMYPTPKQKIYIRFEIPSERVQYEKDGRKYDAPAVIGSSFTASMHENASLRIKLEGWRGKRFTDEQAEAFDVSSILGVACMLSVIENTVGDKTYTNIAAIGSLPKGMPAPKAENPLVYFGDGGTATVEDLPEWLQKKVNEQLTNKPEATRPSTNYTNTEIDDSDIPF